MNKNRGDDIRPYRVLLHHITPTEAEVEDKVRVETGRNIELVGWDIEHTIYCKDQVGPLHTEDNYNIYVIKLEYREIR